MPLFRKLFGGGRAAAPRAPFAAEIAPAERFFAIGDVHGCVELLRDAFSRIDAAAGPGARIVCVGDYVDRGERSGDVLRFLHQQSLDRGDRLVCLAGNHEAMLLEFLDNPEDQASFWFRNGGLQTLASLGISAHSAALAEVRDHLREAMGSDLEGWLRGLPLSWNTGNVWAVHAGANPDKPMELQSIQSLQWGHPDFGAVPRTDGQWVLHGHTIQDDPRAEDGVISIDTGAYATGRLTVAEVSARGVLFDL